MIHTQDADFTLLNCDVLEGLRSLPDESVHCVVTSPPYWGLRDYGTGAWEGGDESCDHKAPPTGGPNPERYTPGGNEMFRAANDKLEQGECRKCGARRVDNQLGLEPTPDLYVQRIVEVFREVRRVLRSDGTCWVNLGDSYISGQGGRQSEAGELPSTSRFDRPDPKPRPDLPNPPSGWAERAVTRRTYPDADSGYKPKDLAGMPWRVAFALQADGWWLRSDIIWAKPNPMPESVTDRPTKAHEYVFLLTKSARYFFDQEAVREPAPFNTNRHMASGRLIQTNNHAAPKALVGAGEPPLSRNVRSVWEIATQPYPEAHFATYPEELVRRCVLAGTSERGCCPVCGAPWEREIAKEVIENGRGRVHIAGGWDHGWEGTPRASLKVGTLGWHPSCDCRYQGGGLAFLEGARPQYEPVPCTVLDPFLGSGTTAHVARKHGRRSIGIELNPDYCELAARRMQQQSLFALDAS